MGKLNALILLMLIPNSEEVSSSCWMERVVPNDPLVVDESDGRGGDRCRTQRVMC